MSHIFTPKVTSNSAVNITDDGTYYTFSFGGVDFFRVVQSTGNFQASGGVDSAWGGE